MKQLKSTIDVTKIDLKEVTWIVDGTGALMAFGQGLGLSGLSIAPTLTPAVLEIERLRRKSARHIMLNTLPPRCILPVHKDPFPSGIERWHLPIQTNEECYLVDRDIEYHAPLGYWTGPLSYWLEHSGYNKGMTDRIHLIVDL